MKWVESRYHDDNDELLEELDQGEGAWELHNKRDFNAEIQTYLENKQLRAE